jgi:peptide/nickel transport system substrate-binding protein
LAALEGRIEAELERGLFAESIAELGPLVAEHPHRERFRAQLMLALYRSGRQAEALEAYRQARAALDEATKGLPCHLKANVAAAKAAFNRSGASAPVDVHLMLGTTTVAARLGALIAGMEKPIGFNVILEPTEFATGLSRAAAGRFDMFQLGWSGRVDPDANLQQFVNAKGSSNYSGYVNAAVDRATNQARSILNSERRIAQYHTALAQLQKDVPLIYLYNQINRFGVSKTVGRVQIYGDGLMRAAFAGFNK